jgi:hypothetical protein
VDSETTSYPASLYAQESVKQVVLAVFILLIQSKLLEDKVSHAVVLEFQTQNSADAP